MPISPIKDWVVRPPFTGYVSDSLEILLPRLIHNKHPIVETLHAPCVSGIYNQLHDFLQRIFENTT